MDAIRINQLSKKYQGKYAIKQIDLTVKEGEIYGFIGPNGAGKSTTIKILMDFIRADEGTSTIFGMDSRTQAKSIRQMTSYVSSDVRFYPTMNSADLLQYTADFHQIKNAKPKIDYLCELLQIDSHKKIGELSLGNKKKTALACGLLPNPRLLILDEPTNGLDPLMQNRLFEELNQRNKKGMTIFLSSHDLSEIQRYAEKAAFIRQGEIITVQDIEKEQQLGKVVTVHGNMGRLTLDNSHILDKKTDYLRFFYQGSLNKLAKFLENPLIKNFTVEDPSLDDQFLRLYEGGDSNDYLQN